MVTSDTTIDIIYIVCCSSFLCYRFKDLAVAAKDAMAGQLEMMKAKYEEAVELRKKAEMDIENFRPVRQAL